MDSLPSSEPSSSLALVLPQVIEPVRNHTNLKIKKLQTLSSFGVFGFAARDTIKARRDAAKTELQKLQGNRQFWSVWIPARVPTPANQPGQRAPDFAQDDLPPAGGQILMLSR